MSKHARLSYEAVLSRDSDEALEDRRRRNFDLIGVDPEAKERYDMVTAEQRARRRAA